MVVEITFHSIRVFTKSALRLAAVCDSDSSLIIHKVKSIGDTATAGRTRAIAR